MHYEADEEIVGNESLDDSRINDFISKPIKSELCTIDENTLQIHHSFGYDCTSKLFNICAVDEHTVVYAAGSYIIVFDTNDGSLRLRRCAGNGGIGHITKNPVSSHLAVGENCDDPLIIVYEWPTFDIVSVLRASTKIRCNWLSFSKNGQILCSQGGEPDSTLTIWDWRRSQIILRTKSHTQEVYVCRFSEYFPNHLVTAGAGHIKFWKMEKTFTGLKLLGQLGRFGKTEISDVVGTLSMDDEKVISGCSWGNILVWDEGLISVELTRKNREPCHSAPIIMFLYSEHAKELTSISMDGTINSWYYHTVSEAKPPDEDRVVEIDPSFTVSVRDAAGIAKIMGLCKTDEDPDSNDYFVQDGNGGIWLVDMTNAANAKRPKRLAKFHGDTISSLQTSPVGLFVATTSLDGWLHVYDVAAKKLIFAHNFGVPVTSSVWLPFKTADSGNVFAIGFQSGILKTVAVPLEGITAADRSPELIEIQSSRPHTGNVSHMAADRGVKILVCGSDDCTIFVYKIQTGPVTLKPIGMYPLPGKVNYIHWNPSAKRKVLISCATGHIVEVNVPANRPMYTKESFRLTLESRVIRTVSVKSEMLRDRHASEVVRKKQEKLERKKRNLNELRENNLGADIDEEFYLQDSDDEEPLPELYVPATPNPVLLAVYTPSGRTVWASIDGFDAGYLYEYAFDAPRPIAATAIPHKGDTPLTAMTALQIGTGRPQLLMGFADGRIRVTNVSLGGVYDLTDYIEYPVHDNKNGRVKTLCFSRDNHMLYTYGDDGNIFSFTFQCDIGPIEKDTVSVSQLPPLPKPIKENTIRTEEDVVLSLEDRKIAKEKRKMLNIAGRKKEMVRCLLFNGKEKFKRTVAESKSLPGPMQFPRDYFQLDERFSNSRLKQARSEAKELRLELEFDHRKSLLGLRKSNYFVSRGIAPKLKISGILTNTLVNTSLNFESHQSIFHGLMETLISQKHPTRQHQKSSPRTKPTEATVQNPKETEIFLRNMDHRYSSLPLAIRYVIDRLRNRLNFEENVTKTIENIRLENLNGPVAGEEDEHAMQNVASILTSNSSNPRGEHTISMNDTLDAYTRVIDKMESSKSVFNEIVADLVKRKRNIALDYKQFNSDVSAIKNELDDPKITIPSDFLEDLLDLFDKVISSYPVDDLETLCRAQSTQSASAQKRRISRRPASRKRPTRMETTIREWMNKERLKHRHACLHESMLRKIVVFDEHISTVGTMQDDQLLAVASVELFALSLKQELLITSVFDLIEDEYEHNAHLHVLKLNSIMDVVRSLKERVRSNEKMVDDKSLELTAVQQEFHMEVRNKKYAKYLWRIFRKKYRPPKVKSDNESSSSSFSSDSSDSESEAEAMSLANDEPLKAANIIAIFDETVRPIDCDERLYDLAFELRSKRHAVERSILQIKTELERLSGKLNTANAEIEVTEKELKRTTAELETYRVKKKSKLNEVGTTVWLNDHQIQSTVPLENSILLNGNTMIQMETYLVDCTKEIEALEKASRDVKSQTIMTRVERNQFKCVLNKQKKLLKSEIKKKFSPETDWHFLDDMEMAIIRLMIDQHCPDLDTDRRAIVAKKNAINAIKLKSIELVMQFNSKVKRLLSMKQQLRIMYVQCQASNENNTANKNEDKGLCWFNQPKKNTVVAPISIDTDLNAFDGAAIGANWPGILDVYRTLLKRKQDVCGELIALLHSDDASGQLSPFADMLVDALGRVAGPDDVIDDRAPTTTADAERRGGFTEAEAEDEYGEATDELHHEAEEGLDDDYDNDYDSNFDYDYDVFDALPKTVEQHFAEYWEEDDDNGDEAVPNNAGRRSADGSDEDVFDEAAGAQDGFLTDGDESVGRGQSPSRRGSESVESIDG